MTGPLGESAMQSKTARENGLSPESERRRKAESITSVSHLLTLFVVDVYDTRYDKVLPELDDKPGPSADFCNLQGLSKRGQKPKEERAQREGRMSMYERSRSGNIFSGDGSRLPNVTPELGKGALNTWRPSRSV
jgi:hypothetical protein